MFFHILNTSQMPDDAEQNADDNMDKAIEDASKEFDDDSDDSQDDSDDSAADSASDSDDSNDDSDDDTTEEDDSDDSNDDSDDSDDSQDDSEDSDDEKEDSDDVDFGVRDMPTNIKNFVAKLEKLDPEKRQETIKALDPNRNKAELEAIKDMFQTDKEAEKSEDFKVPKKEWDDAMAKIAKFENLDKVEEVKALYEQLAKKQPELENELTDRILQEKYGKRFEEVSGDQKFKDQMTELKKLDLPERIAQASMHSKAAREILIEKAATKQNKLKALKGKKAGGSSQKSGTKNNILEDAGFEAEFGDEIAKLEY